MVVSSELASDDFNRADSGTLGANWTVLTNRQAAQIVSNQVEATSTALRSIEYYSAISWPPDQFSEVVIVALPGGGGPGPAVRCDSTSDSCYFLQYNTLDQLALMRNVNGTVIGLITLIASAVANDVLRLEVEGTILRVYKNGVMILQRKDATLTSGSPGVHIDTGGGVLSSAILDSWKGGKLDHPPLYPQFPDRLSRARSEQASDDFNRADSANLGANWTVVPTTSALQIVSNQVEATTTAAVCVDFYSGLPWLSNQFSEAKIVAINVSGAGPGVAVRCSSTVKTYYAFQSSANTLLKVVNGTTTVIGTGGLITVAVNDIIRLEAEDNIIRVLKNGVLIYQVKDSDIEGGSPGLYISTAGDAITTAIVDDWKGGNLVSRPYYGESTRPKLLDPNHVVGLYY